MEALNFERFTKKIYIKAPMAKLYWCWGTSEGIASWFLEKASYIDEKGTERSPSEFIQPNDTYVWKWHNWDTEEKGKVITANKMSELSISFAENCTVSIALKAEGLHTLLTLTQANIPTDEKSKLNIHYGCSNGWTFWLANLKAYLEHGILLNETEKDLRNIPLAGFEFVNM